MHELQSSTGNVRQGTWEPSNSPSLSLPERELLGFIRSVNALIGAQTTSFLTELWLDELASLESTPEPDSPEWHLVTLGAFGRLARRLLEMGYTNAFL